MQQQWFPASSGGSPANGPARPYSFPPPWLFLNWFSGHQPLSPSHQTKDLDSPLPCPQFTVGLFIFLLFWHHCQGKYVGHPSCQHHHLPRWEGHGQLVESWQRIQRRWHSGTGRPSHELVVNPCLNLHHSHTLNHTKKGWNILQNFSVSGWSQSGIQPLIIISYHTSSLSLSSSLQCFDLQLDPSPFLIV